MRSNAHEMTTTIPRAQLSDQGVWANHEDGVQLAIAHYLWMQGEHGPKAEASLSCTQEELQVSLRAYEADPLARYTEHNAHVYKDSCLEFFLQPAPGEDARYLNLEFNAEGTMRIGIGATRNDRVYLELDELPALPIRASKNLLDQETGETYWEVCFRLPLSWLESLFPSFRPRPGAKMRGNLYKCGDETDSPHYGSWSRVQSETPDFHRSEDFGWLFLG
ncbi:carbohydrate-binding family 9-like protein [Paenibacillus sp. HB172176]|uniref:carbohydrate-binding family 9-like protein n=1 Tax=Paenibacillus sp. HB172176 TaxID=2493690 RepID=UPI00143C499C|nr:carbohydrate-binding family 9-like protein [Paenibacillus sp. HB172176]